MNPNRKSTYKLKHKILAGLLIIPPAISWFSVYVIKGTAGVIGWWTLMLFGLVSMIIAVILTGNICIKMIARKSISLAQLLLLFWCIFAAWPGLWLTGKAQLAYPASIETTSPKAVVDLPFGQTVLTGWGGDTLKENYHVWLPVERFAYDFILPSTVPDSTKLSDYPIFGVPVLAPAEGRVVMAVSTEPDGIPHSDNATSQLGNVVVIELTESKTYLVLSHLKQNSLTVKTGDSVNKGDVIGAVGNSGSSSEPHLHIHHQRQNPVTNTMLLSEGLPLLFYTKEGNFVPKGGIDPAMTSNASGKPSGDWVSPNEK